MRIIRGEFRLKDGLSVEAKIFSIIVAALGQGDVDLAVGFECAQPVLDAKFLEDPGLIIDPQSRTLEPTRHQRFGYNHES